MSLWPKRIGHGTGTVHVKSAPILFSQNLFYCIKRKITEIGVKRYTTAAAPPSPPTPPP